MTWLWLVEERVMDRVITRFFGRIDRESTLAVWEAQDA